MSDLVKDIEYFNSTETCRRIQNESLSVLDWHARTTVRIEKWEAVVIFVTTGILSMLLASVYWFIRHNVHKDVDDLDTTFHAGGNMNAGLTASFIVSQMTWTATLLQSSTVAAKYGISGSFWYASCASIQIILFSMLAVQLKIRAPGAKTFLQVIKARFGDGTHIVFCIFALVTNIFVTCMLMLGGGAVITTLVHDMSLEYALTLVTAIVGGYTFVGGLGATIYVSYFDTSIIYVILLILIYKVYEDDSSKFSSIGSISKVYDYVSCAKGPDGNNGNSYLTFISENGLMFGIITLVGNFGTVFVDQSYWQCAVAAKPQQGAIGFILAGLAWFAIPFSLSTAMGLGYIAMSAEQGTSLLSIKHINEGLIVPTMVSLLLGKPGAILVLILVLVAITSTAAAEVMAVTSILVYDIYATHVRPFRTVNDINNCVLCGRPRGRKAHFKDECDCISFNYCAECYSDTKNRVECRRAVLPDYKCRTHGYYREYKDILYELKSWTVVWITLSIIPLTLILHSTDLSLNFVYSFMGVGCGSAVIPIILSMVWNQVTSSSMAIGAISGTCLSMTSWILAASLQEGGLGNFKKNAGKETVMLIGNVVAILSGGLITVVVAVVNHKRAKDWAVDDETWERTRDLDNPLSPWSDIYTEELGVIDVQHLNNRPTLVDTLMAFTNVMVLAKRTSLTITLFLLLVIPIILTFVGTMNVWEFTAWIMLSQAWALSAANVMIIVPLANEAWKIWLTMHKAPISQSELLRSQSFMIVSLAPTDPSLVERSVTVEQEVEEEKPISTQESILKDLSTHSEKSIVTSTRAETVSTVIS